MIWISGGDNGAGSVEGSVTGSFNELTMQNGIPLTDEMPAPARGEVRRSRRTLGVAR